MSFAVLSTPPPVAPLAGNSALSGDAELIGRSLAGILEFPVGGSVEDRRASVLELIHAAAQEASHEDWDGEGAAAIQLATIENAIRFAQMLPATVAPPEVSPDSNGDISFDWIRGPRRVFSVSIGPDGVIHYAGLFGYNKSHGSEFLAESLPSAVRNNIRRALRETVA